MGRWWVEGRRALGASGKVGLGFAGWVKARVGGQGGGGGDGSRGGGVTVEVGVETAREKGAEGHGCGVDEKLGIEGTVKGVVTWMCWIW